MQKMIGEVNLSESSAERYKSNSRIPIILKIIKNSKKELNITKPIEVYISSESKFETDFLAKPSVSKHRLFINEDLLDYTNFHSPALKITLMDEMKRFSQKEGIKLSKNNISKNIENIRQQEVLLYPGMAKYNLSPDILEYIKKRVKIIKNRLNIRHPVIINILPYSYESSIGAIYSQKMFNLQTVLTLVINLEFIQTNAGRIINNPDFDAFLVHEFTHLISHQKNHNSTFKKSFTDNMETCSIKAGTSFDGGKAFADLQTPLEKRNKAHQLKSPDLKIFNILIQTSSGKYQITRSQTQIAKDLKNYDSLKHIFLSEKEKISLIKILNNLDKKKSKKELSKSEHSILKNKAIYRVILRHLNPGEKKKLMESNQYKKFLLITQKKA